MNRMVPPDLSDQISATAPLRFGRFELQPLERRVLLDGTPISLGARALDVLLVLAQRAGQLVSKQELLDRVLRLRWPRAWVS